MFREKYKNANCCIDSSEAYERVEKKLEESRKLKINWQQVTSMAACLVIAVAGISAYEINQSSDDEFGTDIISPVSETEKSARIYEPEYDTEDTAIQESNLSDISIIEESIDNFEKILNDGSYQKREINGAVIIEKYEGTAYECWIKKDESVTKITAIDISQEEKEDIIKLILQ